MFATTETDILFIHNNSIQVWNYIANKKIGSFEISNVTCLAGCDDKILIGTKNSEIYMYKNARIDLIYENKEVGPIQSISIRNIFVLFVGSKLAYFITLKNNDINYLHTKLNKHSGMLGGDISENGMFFVTYSFNKIRVYDKSKFTLLLWDSCIAEKEVHFRIQKIYFLQNLLLIQSTNHDLYFYDLDLNLVDYKHFTRRIKCIDCLKNRYLVLFDNKIEIYEVNFNKIHTLDSDKDEFAKFISFDNIITFKEGKFYMQEIEKEDNQYVNPFFEIQGTDTKTEDEKGGCIFCMENRANVCLLPCGHIYSCIKCSRQYIAKTFPCSLCRQYPENVVKVFIPN